MKKAAKILIAGMFAAAAASPFGMFLAFGDVAASEVSAAAARSSYDRVAISQVSNYVNVRAAASTDSEIVGKIYNNCAANILATVDGEGGTWYQIQSGTVKGYIKAEYFITGAEAEKIAKKVGTMRATIVNADSLRLHEAPSLDSKTLTLLDKNSEYVALEETGDFVKLQIDSDLTGYVHKDYVKIRVVFKEAVSMEEERRLQAESDQRKKEADEAIAKLEELKKDENAPSAAVPSTEAASEAGNGNEPQSNRAPASVGTIAANPLETAPPSSGGAESNTPGQSGLIAPGGQGGQSSQSSPGGQSGQGNPDGRPLEPGMEYGPGAGPGVAGGNGESAVTSATRTAIVAYAKQFLGNPYVYGGTSLTQGADCSGFTMRVYEHFGIDTGRTSRDQANKGREISLDEIQSGDLLFYESGGTINHVAMYIGGGQVIHSSTPSTGITISTAFYRTPCKAVSFLD